MPTGPDDDTPSCYGGIDFEPTDFATARAALDEPPAGLARLPTLAPGYWEARRRKALASDRALTGATIDWMLALPPRLRPRRLGERFPRVVNAIAAAWDDAPRRAKLLDDLLTDRRGGRRGFPAEIRGEIEALRRG